MEIEILTKKAVKRGQTSPPTRERKMHGAMRLLPHTFPVAGDPHPAAGAFAPVPRHPDVSGARLLPVAGNPHVTPAFPLPVAGNPNRCFVGRNWPNLNPHWRWWRFHIYHPTGTLGAKSRQNHKQNDPQNRTHGCFHVNFLLEIKFCMGKCQWCARTFPFKAVTPESGGSMRGKKINDGNIILHLSYNKHTLGEYVCIINSIGLFPEFHFGEAESFSAKRSLLYFSLPTGSPLTRFVPNGTFRRPEWYSNCSGG